MDSVYCLGDKKIKRKNKSVLFSKGNISDYFFTEQGNLYFDAGEEQKTVFSNAQFDSLRYRVVKKYTQSLSRQSSDKLYFVYRKISQRIRIYNNKISQQTDSIFQNMSLVRAWNTSMLTAVIIGMVTMSFIYRYLGQGVSAENYSTQYDYTQVERQDNWTTEKEQKYLSETIDKLKQEEKKDFEKKVRQMVKGYPIEKMLPYILEKDRIVAAFIIGMGKKESNWGKRVPVLNGEDCYNYWGYRGKRKRMGTGGHTCFNSRKDAVDTVAKRIDDLVNKYNRNTPKEMVVWKCGSNCSVTGGQAAADKWIRDVDLYFSKLYYNK